jgi:hypothetical protein
MDIGYIECGATDCADDITLNCTDPTEAQIMFNMAYNYSCIEQYIRLCAVRLAFLIFSFTVFLIVSLSVLERCIPKCVAVLAYQCFISYQIYWINIRKL